VRRGWKAKYEQAQGEIETLKHTLEHVTAVEAGCSSIPVEWREIGGARIGLDAAGSAVRIELPDVTYGWDAE
jgi:hypothetical protein